MPRLPDLDRTLAVTRAIASAPTAPWHEHRALGRIHGELTALGLAPRRDRYGQLTARVAGGTAKRPLAIVAHTDHPGFEVIEARGATGRVRVLGGLAPRCFDDPVAVEIHHDDGRAPLRGVLDDYVRQPDALHNSSGTLRIEAESALSVGMWAVLDLPAFARDGDRLQLRAADDLAGCAMAVLTVAALAHETRAFDLHLLFTRGEETGLYGARIAAEDGTLPREAIVVSVEASRELPSAQAGRGIVVRTGDRMNTFSNEAERALRVAQERVDAGGVATQRALLTGGTCEASAFVRAGYLATGVALPDVNYHNEGSDGRFAPELVHLADIRSGVALLAEAAVTAAEDAEESWWTRGQHVPDAVRKLLAKGP